MVISKTFFYHNQGRRGRRRGENASNQPDREEEQQDAPPQNPPVDATQVALQAMMGQMVRMA